MIYPLVKVEWLDAHTDNGWDEIKLFQSYKACRVISVGYMLTMRGDWVLASTVDIENETANCVITIPDNMVVDFEWLD